MNSDITSRVVAIQKLKQEVAFRTQAIESLVVLKEESQKAERNSDLLKNILPTSDALINFRREINLLAAQNKIDLGFTFGVDSPATDVQPGFINFQMTPSGQLQNFINFLKNIEQGAYFVELNSLDINRTGKTFAGAITGRIFSR